LILRNRTELAPEVPESQGALLLIHAREVGPNVDRLTARTGLSRDFVARALRRLVDNSCWADGKLVENWSAEPLECPAFWRDVDVALGRKLRRLTPEMEPEWAEVREWVKDFNYRGSGSTADALPNEYYAIAKHDPEPAYFPVEVSVEKALLVEDAVGKSAGSRAFGGDELFLGVKTAPLAGRLSDPAPDGVGEPLMQDWAEANWLG
jgi:hypothetical protein